MEGIEGLKVLYTIDKNKENWRQEWLLARRQGIGGSDIAAICGLNPWTSELKIWYDKTSDTIEESSSISAEVGLALEPFLAKKFAVKIKEYENIDLEVKFVNGIIGHKDIPYFIVDIDGYIQHPVLLITGVEFKTTTEYNKDLWKDEEIPIYYYLQCQWSMLVTGWKNWYIGYLIGNRIYDIKIIPRNEKVIKNLVERANHFWNNFVLTKIPPAPGGTKSDDQIIKSLYPEETAGKELYIPEENLKEVESWLNQLDNFNKIKKDNDNSIDKIKQQVKFLMKDNEFCICGTKKITFKSISKHVEAYDSTYRELRIKDL